MTILKQLDMSKSKSQKREMWKEASINLKTYEPIPFYPRNLQGNTKPIKVLDMKDLSLYRNNKNKNTVIKLILLKGNICVSCNKEGKHLLKCMRRNGLTTVNVFTEDFIVMTVDHIVPISKGGNRTNLNNLQVMCQKCNMQKANK